MANAIRHRGGAANLENVFDVLPYRKPGVNALEIASGARKLGYAVGPDQGVKWSVLMAEIEAGDTVMAHTWIEGGHWVYIVRRVPGGKLLVVDPARGAGVTSEIDVLSWYSGDRVAVRPAGLPRD